MRSMSQDKWLYNVPNNFLIKIFFDNDSFGNIITGFTIPTSQQIQNQAVMEGKDGLLTIWTNR